VLSTTEATKIQISEAADGGGETTEGEASMHLRMSKSSATVAAASAKLRHTSANVASGCISSY
jgi:hypothetical protein